MIAAERALAEAIRAHGRCPRCGKGYPIAPACLAGHLELVPPDACPRCAQRRVGGRCLSLGCRRGWFCLGTTHVALGYKRGGVQRIVLAAKDRADPAAVNLLGRFLAGFILDALRRSYDLFLPVPFHRGALRGRPVHPLTAIYLDAAPVLRPPLPLDDLAPPFLVQTRAVLPALRRRPERDRWDAVRGAFALGFRTRMLRGARILLLDDVMTTGATLSECARVLIEDGGAAAVDAAVLVRQPWRARSAGDGCDTRCDEGDLPC